METTLTIDGQFYQVEFEAFPAEPDIGIGRSIEILAIQDEHGQSVQPVGPLLDRLEWEILYSL